MTICKRCNLDKEDSNFKQVNYNSRGYKPICFACSKKPGGRPKSQNPFTPERKKEHARIRWIRHKYNLSVEEYNRLYESQNKQCGICKVNSGTVLHIDHDHETNTIRGLLCASCNKGLGMFKDNITSLENAIEYLKKFTS
jgi:hypothetical protein